MTRGSLALVLHAHLPFVRHPEHDDFLEERWLFEAMAESHLPLLDALWRWRDEGVPAPLTLSVSPTLAAMWGDPLLQSRFARHLDRLDALLDREAARHAHDDALRPLVALHRDRVARARRVWRACDRDPFGALSSLAADGALALWTTSATHAFLPGLAHHPWMRDLQVDLGVRDHTRRAARAPDGFWLPECGYTPDVGRAVHRAGAPRVVVESHSVLHASPRPPWGTAVPVRTPEGLTVFGRDGASAQQVWSRDVGFPGDPSYRDHHRDLGFTLPTDELRDFLAADGTRQRTGVGYWRVTDRGTDVKALYDPTVARETVRAHARRFVDDRVAAVRWHASRGLDAPCLVAPYDAELFGHWWFEGVDFLDAVFRALRDTGKALAPVALDRWETPVHHADPAEGTWGEGGHAAVWLDPANAWMLRPVDRALTQTARALSRFRDVAAAGAALRECVREALLLVSSDWAFLVRTGAAPHYARARVEAHCRRVDQLAAMCEAASHDAARGRVEEQASLFPNLDLSAVPRDVGMSMEKRR